MKLLNKNILTMAITTVVTGVAVFVIGGNSTVADGSKDLPAPPEGPFSVEVKAENNQSIEGKQEVTNELVAGIPPAIPETPQKLPPVQVGDLNSVVADAPLAPEVPKNAAILVPASESLSGKKLPAQLEKPEALNAPERAVAFPKVDPVVQAVPDAPEVSAAAPIAPSLPKEKAQSHAAAGVVKQSAETVAVRAPEPVMNIQMPIAPTMPQMQSPVMAPDMQMKIHRPVMDTGIMQTSGKMVMPAMPEMEMPPQLPMPQPILVSPFPMSAPLTDISHQPSNTPVSPVAPEQKVK